jgi:redox-sensing transcriptional repressor
LHAEIGKILGLDQVNNVIIVGAGNLGQALANYQFEPNGFRVLGLFDVNPRLVGLSVRGVEIYDIDTLEEFIKTHDIKIAALTLPKQMAPDMAKSMVQWGIKAFWNFAPIDLKLPGDIMVENVHLAESLMTLSYRIHSTEH